MSGTSLDGLDIAICEFWFDTKWNFKILRAKTYKYETSILNKLKRAKDFSALEFIEFHNFYGKYIGTKINEFLKNEKVDLISSHGHTIFHQPEKGLTFQIGNGANILAETKITTISDFRTFDVAMGGQGAPLVPIGDKFLFGDYKYCLNIGGFANISSKNKENILAYDICPANIALNYFSQKINFDFDFEGKLGKSGSINLKLLNELNKLNFYSLKHPKSLGREWFESEFLTIIKKFNISEIDILATLYEHISEQISKNINQDGDLLITGGGAKNSFLIELIKNKLNGVNVVLPDNNIIDFKEALIFAFLGLLRFLNKENVLSDVTGASKNIISGNIYKI